MLHVGTAVARPESMATSQTALLEGPGRRNAVGDVDKTAYAQLKLLRLRELFHLRSTATSREPSPSTAAGPSAEEGQEDRSGVVDSTAVRPSSLGRCHRRAVPAVGRSRGEDAATLNDVRRTLPKSQTSFDSYVTAPSQDEYQMIDDDDEEEGQEPCQSPSSLRHPEARRGDAVALITENRHRRAGAVAFPVAANELPLVDFRVSATMPSNISPDSGTTDFEFDPFEYELETGDSEDDIDTKKVTVPVTICLVIIAGYIFAGAVLFTLWEDWDYLTGSYFCFITLSTIGFGDIVPGTDMDKWASSEKLVLCALWLAFGLSLLAMCFNLMQEEVKEKCKWIGKKLGLLKDGEGDR